MAAMVSNGENQAWNDYQAILPQGVQPDDESMQYSFAVVYTGPRPNHVPKAVPVSSSSRRPQVTNRSDEGSASCPSPRVLVSCSTPRVGLYLASADMKRHSNSSQGQASIETGVLDDARTNSFDAGVSMDDMQNSIPAERGEGSSFSEEEDHHPSFVPHSSSFLTSTNSGNGSSEETNDQSLSDQPPLSDRQRKKGECYMCSKVSRMPKEACLVCNAQYCRFCVLRAMGSMPEGRKCVRCMGQPICESKRSKLGKPSGLLNRLVSALEVQQIMKAERECSSNQLRPEQVYVNGRQLSDRELAQLVGCPNPPSKLKPGRYWYDGQCGYWGKEGEKPEKIITASLIFGGQLAEDASAGCTKVYINQREITKSELKMLKLAGVQCPPNTRLWVYPDGNYQEEGQNNQLGNIWGKPYLKYLYLLWSLPVPNSITEVLGSVAAYLEPKTSYKILLLGHDGCGTSTIIKQVKYLYGEQYTPKDLEDMKALIQTNIYKYIVILLDARDRFEEEENAIRAKLEENTPSTSASRDTGGASQKKVYTMSPRLKEQANWFLATEANGTLEAYFPSLTREHASLIDEFWRDPAIQATFKRRAEIPMLPDVAQHFLEKVVEISTTTYSPTEKDILYTEGVVHDSGFAEIEFSMDEEDGRQSGPYNDSTMEAFEEARYHVIRLSRNCIGDNYKLLKMFEDVQVLIFCVALDCYDQILPRGKTAVAASSRNQMLVSRDLFENVLKFPAYQSKPVVLFLNKFDAFQEKLSNVPLTACEWFSDYDPVRSSRNTPEMLAQQAYTYIARMFKKHFEMIRPSGKLFTFSLRALEGSSVKGAFRYVKDVLISEEMNRMANRGWQSHYITETSTLTVTAN